MEPSLAPLQAPRVWGQLVICDYRSGPPLSIIVTQLNGRGSLYQLIMYVCKGIVELYRKYV